MFADMAVLSADLFTVPVAEIEALRSVMTIFGGKVIYDTGVVH
jgi:predicted amidohydrolase YtcJ